MISQAYTEFFTSLEENNTTEWFRTNKKKYEGEVKVPFLNLINEVIEEIGTWHVDIDPDPKKAMFRINRDIRFSKDKSPYNTIMKAAIVPHGRKSGMPGYYIGIDARQAHLGGGLYDLASPDLKKVRQYLSDHYREFEDIVNHLDFTEAFGEIRGDKVTRLTGDLKSEIEQKPLLLNKQFYAMKRTTNATEVSKEEILKTLGAMKPMVEFFTKALQS